MSNAFEWPRIHITSHAKRSRSALLTAASRLKLSCYRSFGFLNRRERPSLSRDLKHHINQFSFIVIGKNPARRHSPS